MIGIKATRRKGSKEEAEKPFWISFSDLMTALMVLFLVAMAVALIAVTPGLATINKEKEERDKTMQSCIADVDALTKQVEFKGVTMRGNSIDFGTLVLFGNNKHVLESPAQEQFVRKFVPRVLDLARSEKCEKWLKRVVVEGFASREGEAGYLYNLNLSYLRSQRVQTLFLVGGSSFNTAAGEASQMRRVELKLEFRDLGSEREKATDIPLDPGLKCPND